MAVRRSASFVIERPPPPPDSSFSSFARRTSPVASTRSTGGLGPRRSSLGIQPLFPRVTGAPSDHARSQHRESRHRDQFPGDTVDGKERDADGRESRTGSEEGNGGKRSRGNSGSSGDGSWERHSRDLTHTNGSHSGAGGGGEFQGGLKDYLKSMRPSVEVLRPEVVDRRHSHDNEASKRPTIEIPRPVVHGRRHSYDVGSPLVSSGAHQDSSPGGELVRGAERKEDIDFRRVNRHSSMRSHDLGLEKEDTPPKDYLREDSPPGGWEESVPGRSSPHRNPSLPPKRRPVREIPSMKSSGVQNQGQQDSEKSLEGLGESKDLKTGERKTEGDSGDLKPPKGKRKHSRRLTTGDVNGQRKRELGQQNEASDSHDCDVISSALSGPQGREGRSRQKEESVEATGLEATADVTEGEKTQEGGEASLDSSDASSREAQLKALADLHSAASFHPHPEVVYGAMIPEPDYSDEETGETKNTSYGKGNLVSRNNRANAISNNKDQKEQPQKDPLKEVNNKSPMHSRLDDKGLIMPKKLINPCLESSDKKNLHRELLFNQKMGLNVLNQKSELQKAMEKHKDKQVLKEQEKERQQQLTPFQKVLEERAQKLETLEKDDKVGPQTEGNPSTEFHKIHAKVRAKMEAQ